MRNSSVIAKTTVFLPLVFMLVFAAVNTVNDLKITQALADAAWLGVREAAFQNQTGEEVRALIKQRVFEETGIAADAVAVDISVTPVDSHGGTTIEHAAQRDVITVDLRVARSLLSFICLPSFRERQIVVSRSMAKK